MSKVTFEEILQREPIGRSLAMMKTPMRDPEWEATRFIGLTMGDQKQQTPPGLIQYNRHMIEASCAAASGDDETQFQAYLDGLDRIWPELEKKMAASYGLAEYVRTLAGHSLFLPNYYATLYHPLSMEAPYAQAVRLDGKFMDVPTSDVAYGLCAREPIFSGKRFCAVKQQLVQLELGDNTLHLILGANMLPEYNHFGWQERGIKQRIVAYDNDPRVEESLKSVFGERQLCEMGVEYRFDDFWNALKDPELQGAVDMVAMEGGLSYYVPETEDLFRGVAQVLRPGGYFCGEVELMHYYTVRCGVLGWQMARSMQPDKDADSATKRLEATAGKVGLKLLEAAVDDYCLQSAVLWVKLQKI